MKNLIPKSLSKQKGIFYKNISWYDLAFCLLEILISCGITFGLIFLEWWIRVVIALGIFLILSIFTLPLSKYNDCRFYKLIWYKIKFLVSPKNYYDTTTLNPYKEIKDDFIFTKKPNDGKSHYIGILKIKGLDLNSLNEQETKIKLDQFHSILINIKKHFSIAKINQKFAFYQQEKNLKEKIRIIKSNYDNAKISEKTYKAQLEQLNNQLEILKNINTEVETNPFQQNFYLFLYDSKLNDLLKDLENAKNDFDNMGLESNILNKYESINVIKNIFNPFEDDISNQTIDDNETNLDSIFDFKNIKFKKDHVLINNQLYLMFHSISDYALEVDYYWLSFVLLSTNANVIINAKQINQGLAISLMNKAIVNTASNQYNEKKQVQKMQYENLNNAFKEMSQEIIKHNQCVFKTNIIILNYDVEYKSLMNTRKQVEKIFNSNQIKLNRLKYRQFDALNSFLPKINDSLNYIAREIPSKTLANGYPFISNTLNDNDGLLLGKNWLSNPVIFDQFYLDENRKNHNMVILGSSGSGKSFFSKKIINWNAMINNRIFILDVENEYEKITKYYDGNNIDIGLGNSGIINPLQIISFNNNETNMHNMILNHLLILETFFKIIFNEINNQQLRYLINLIKECYFIHNFDKLEINEIENDMWLRFDDIYNFAISKQNQLIKLYELNDVKYVHELLRSELIDGAKLSNLYNKHTNIKIDKNVVCFNLHSLFNKNNERIIQAQLFLTLNYIQNEINENYSNEFSSIILIDEAHLLIDDKNPVALDFVYQMIKRIRKRNGSIILITQNPDDFVANETVAKKTNAILNNTQYSLFFNLAPNNLKDVVEMYKSYGSGLSEDEQLFIAKAKRGQALFFVSGFNRYKINIFVSDNEKNAFNIT